MNNKNNNELSIFEFKKSFLVKNVFIFEKKLLLNKYFKARYTNTGKPINKKYLNIKILLIRSLKKLMKI